QFSFNRITFFKIIYNLLQNSADDDILMEWKRNIIQISFNGIDESDHTLSSHMWKCILLIQSKYEDWYKYLDFKSDIQPKVSCLLQNNFFNNYETICPNLLSFNNAVVCAYFQEYDWHIYFEQYLMDLKNVFCSEAFRDNETHYNAIFAAYFSCWEFILNKLNNAGRDPEHKQKYIYKMLLTNVIDSVECLLISNKNIAIKRFASMTVNMITNWKTQCESGDNSLFYLNLLNEFWSLIFHLINELIHINDHYPDGIIELVQSLVQRNEEHVSEKLPTCLTSQQHNCVTGSANEDRLRKIALEMLQHCLRKIRKQHKKCLKHVKLIIDMFPDIEFYKSITSDCDVSKSINIFVNLISVVDKEFDTDVAEIIFKLLPFLDADEQFIFIKTHIFSIRSRELQILILESLFFNRLKIGKRREIILCEPEVRSLIINCTINYLAEYSESTKDWTQMLFLQNDYDEFLIGAGTVDDVLNIIFEPLEKEENDDLSELCGNLLSQVMPIVFTRGNASIETKSKMFLKLFNFLIEHSAEKFSTESILYKLTSCWENALSNEIIVNEETVTNCIESVTNKGFVAKLMLKNTLKVADLITRLIMGVVKDSSANEECIKKQNKLINLFFSSNDNSELQSQFRDYCLSLEILHGYVSTQEKICYNNMDCRDLYLILQRSLLNVYIVQQFYERLDVMKDKFSCNQLRALDINLRQELMNCIVLANAGESILKMNPERDTFLKMWVQELSAQISSLMYKKSNLAEMLQEMLLQNTTKPHYISYCRSLSFFVFSHQYLEFGENAAIILTEELFAYFLSRDVLTPYINFLQFQLPQLGYRSISVQNISVCAKSTNVWIKSASLCCFVANFFKSNVMEIGDRNVATQILGFIREMSEKLYTDKKAICDVAMDDHGSVIELVEYIRLLTEVIRNMPWCLKYKDWDIVIIGLSSWVPRVLNSIEKFADLKVALFTINVCRLFATFVQLIRTEKKCSSTLLIQKTIDEWEYLFEKDVSCGIFNTFYRLLQTQESSSDEYFSMIFKELENSLLLLDFNTVYSLCKNSDILNLEDVFNFLLGNIFNSNVAVQRTCFYILRELTIFFVADDSKYYDAINSKLHLDEGKQHYLQRFAAHLASQDIFVEKHITEFSFKISEIDEFVEVDNQKAFSYMYIWDCVIYACVTSPLFVRTIYTSWLFEHKFIEKFLHFLIRAMPTEILKNYDRKFLTCEIFNSLSLAQINDDNLTLGRYACHLYTEVLKKLPAVVRKWWNILPSRKKSFLDKLTTNFVSPLICDEELKSIYTNKEKHENMQVTVHLSTREVLAVYFVDDVRTELTITLSSNYPLGPVKVDCGKNIGGRLSSRNIIMQLALFLTHQNGTILDGLALWKYNMDKKFEGVEECYVCYTVIHQDTCQLPKLTCKTCKKKFHGSCLYKWFTTSSKSTCPICRNVF
ncbi:PREDICTED: E3 ubiquitin-protein ligase listerin, partial [Rhagoletis zephyria]|uniref:E3 ubiquitin-protein ligase listerin n=2 Tax=Rhagoletis TaxID=28609 RepID=UPI0008114F83